jgi:hypothetical protein
MRISGHVAAMLNDVQRGRFESRIDRSVEGGCWIWVGGRFKTGYGSFSPSHGKRLKAHRVSYELACGPIPPGMFVCHHCDNPPCVNPAHLFVGTPRDNMEDARRKGRLAAGERSWSRMHPERLARGVHNGNSKLGDDDIREILRSYNAGELTQVELSARFGVGQTTISEIVRGEHWKHLLPSDFKRRTRRVIRHGLGSNNGAAKLDEETVRKIIARAATGIPHKQLARECGVSSTLIRQIVRRKIWRHVDVDVVSL